MTEFWVSKSRYYCKLCNSWMADNKISRSLHENGVKHKMSLELAEKKKREERFHGAGSERELTKQLKEIENAARSAIVFDRLENSNLFHSSSISLPTAPPPPPLISRNLQTKQFHSLEADPDLLSSEKQGHYQVGDQWYLEGKIYEQFIVTGVECQVFLEGEGVEEGWIDCVVCSRQDVPVPHTALTFPEFSITYLMPGSGKSFSQKERQQDSVDPRTGLGLWTTVNSRVFDEEEEQERIEREGKEQAEKARLDEEEEFRAMNRKRQGGPGAGSEGGGGGGEGEGDALSSFDPRGRGIYRGVRVETERNSTLEDNSLSEGKGKVTFKKRKGRTETQKPRSETNQEIEFAESKITEKD